MEWAVNERGEIVSGNYLLTRVPATGNFTLMHLPRGRTHRGQFIAYNRPLKEAMAVAEGHRMAFL